MARSLARSKGRRESGTFAAIPHAVMDSEDFRALSGGALKVLLGLLRQYRGANNGDLSASFTQAKQWGMNSRTTLAKALEELQARDLIVRTREGRFIKPGGCCALYAITWRPIDPCDEKIEVSPTATAPRKFSLERVKNPVQKVDALRPENGLMEAC
ncbi:hypothetical protein JVX91_03015 [Pseudomonas sp. PDNC002]|uniref:hypothetical protein n=1 Tax=Pseudomonas sp. PDNC002 TaxID=2811422 RepID=UPI001964C64E|nr:hypothetical protein [Pseudomonas sp. PDNC002]QRY80108.1 hypothetical protein JVX91_03015 [Pseudomonas sp. PDNC002]